MIRRPLRYYYLRIVRQSGTPHQIAAGLAMGVLFGLAVLPGLQIVTLLPLVLWLKYNRFSAILGVLITNPLTMPFIYYWQFRLGRWLTGMESSRSFPRSGEELYLLLTDFGANVKTLLIMFVGALVSGIITALATYYTSKIAIEKFQDGRRERLAAKREKRERLAAEKDALKGVHGPMDL